MGLSLVAMSGGYSLVAAHGLFTVAASLVSGRLHGAQTSTAAALRLSSYDSWAIEHSLNSCGVWAQFFTGCGIFPDQGSILCLLHWQADSLPLSHQGSLFIHS